MTVRIDICHVDYKDNREFVPCSNNRGNSNTHDYSNDFKFNDHGRNEGGSSKSKEYGSSRNSDGQYYHINEPYVSIKDIDGDNKVSIYEHQYAKCEYIKNSLITIGNSFEKIYKECFDNSNGGFQVAMDGMNMIKNKASDYKIYLSNQNIPIYYFGDVPIYLSSYIDQYTVVINAMVKKKEQHQREEKQRIEEERVKSTVEGSKKLLEAAIKELSDANTAFQSLIKEGNEWEKAGNAAAITIVKLNNKNAQTIQKENIKKLNAKVEEAKKHLEKIIKKTEEAEEVARQEEIRKTEKILKEAKEHLENLEKDKKFQSLLKAQEDLRIKEHNKLVHQELIREKTEYFNNKEKELSINLGIDEIKNDFLDNAIYITAAAIEKLPFPITKILGRAILMTKATNDVLTIGDEKIEFLVKASHLEQEKKEFCDSIKEVNNELHTTCEFCSAE